MVEREQTLSIDERKRAWYPGKEFEDLRYRILNYQGKRSSSIEEAAIRLGLHDTTLVRKIEQGEILALPVSGELFVPFWQFNDESQVFKQLPELIKQNSDDPWGLADKLTTVQPNSDGRVPIDLMRQGSEDSFEYLLPD